VLVLQSVQNFEAVHRLLLREVKSTSEGTAHCSAEALISQYQFLTLLGFSKLVVFQSFRHYTMRIISVYFNNKYFDLTNPIGIWG
jgi:hypothetical protein